MFNFRYCAYLIVLIGYSCAAAGSFEDFFLAVDRNDTATVKSLLQRGFDPNSVNAAGEYALVSALRQSSFDVAQALIETEDTDINVRTVKDETPLMLAAIRGRVDLCLLLIIRDADVNRPGWTPLHYAASFSGGAGVVRLLLDHYAYIDAASPNGTTPLMMASAYGSLDVVKLLLDSGADAGLKNDLGMTALDFATRANKVESAAWIARFVRKKEPEGSW
jgi:hypothetical protein